MKYCGRYTTGSIVWLLMETPTQICAWTQRTINSEAYSSCGSWHITRPTHPYIWIMGCGGSKDSTQSQQQPAPKKEETKEEPAAEQKSAG